MIDKINSQKYYDYAKVNQQKRESAEASGFNLNLGKEGVIYEQNEQKKTEKPKETALEQESAGVSAGKASGVKLEISDRGYQKSVREKQRGSLVEEVKKYAQIAVEFLKTVWDRVWNDKPEVLEPEQVEQEEFPEILEDKIAESIYTQAEIRRIFQRGNQQEIADFISNHGEKQLAKNTELLTQYDKTGSLVGISNSDKDLILHGDRNQMKL
ncbi:MAG: hypothetical protein HFH50_02860 [Lachnospiraceae bacterium]|jgi:hypothetical protein|nr:hypothetical protein [Lachnospiraceae bacterium]